MKTYLTSKELRTMNACEEALFSFRTIFGKKATIKQVVHRLQNPGEKDKYAKCYETWLSWLMAQKPELTIAFLNAGTNVHANGDYALRWAARRGRTEIVKILLKAGADVHADRDDALYWTATNGYTEIVKILLKAGADVHEGNDCALRWAAEYGHTEIVKALLKAGADVHAVADYALRRAAKNGHAETVKILKAAMKKK